MPDFDLLIRNAGNFPALGIAEGRIAALAEGSATEEIDATGLTILPGAIDAHVHFNEPGRADWEGFATGSRACAVGGTTTFFEMPLNASPPTTDARSFDQKLAAAQASSLCDFALWGGIVPWNLEELETMHDRGVIGLKAFMSKCGTSDFSLVNVSTLRAAMRIAAQLGAIVAVHAEFDRPELRSGSTVRDYCRSRPLVSELNAIEAALDLAAQTGCALHIVHVSSGSGVALIAKARAAGLDVTCETCPHFLHLTQDDMERLGPVAKCAPPLRDAAEQAQLHAQVLAGDVQTIGSDHSPAPPSMKTDANFFKVWGGISSCQHLLALLLDLGWPAELIGSVTAGNVARRFRVAPQKGGLVPGADADLVLVDPRGTTPVTIESLQYKHRQTPFLGRELRGRIVRTLLRGQTIAVNGRPVGAPRGRLLKPLPRV